MKKIEKIFKYIESQGLSVSGFERKAGLSNSYLKNTLDRKEDISSKMLEKAKKELGDEYYTIFPEERQNADVQEPDSRYEKNSLEQLYTQTLLNLSESNKALAEANRQLAEAHRLIAKNNDELLQMTKSPTAHAAEQTHLDVAETFADVLEVIAKVGTGKRWHTLEEAHAELNKVVPAYLKRIGAIRTRNDSRKEGSVK